MKILKQTILVSALLGISQVTYAQFIGSNPIQQGSAGNVAIGSPAYVPTSLLQVRNGSVAFEGTTGNTPLSGAGTRLMWIPSKGAFRAGVVASNSWDDASIGTNSFAVNFSTKASGAESFASGYASAATGSSTFVTGNFNAVSGACSFSAGAGNNVTATGATAFGTYHNVKAYTEFVAGQYSIDGNYNTTNWVLTDPLFVIGNGTSASARSNAVTILKNGNIGIGNGNMSLNDKLSIGGTLRMNNNNIFLSGDANHGIGYYGVFTGTGNYAGYGIDGPVVFGWSGGALGTKNAGINNIALSWNTAGNVGIGTSNPGSYRLAVEGKIGAREVVVTNATWADFVFAPDYKLKSLNEVENYIKENKHLPEIPSAAEIEKNGLSIGEAQAKQMQKIEELTLYLIEQNKTLIQQNKRIQELENLVKSK